MSFCPNDGTPQSAKFCPRCGHQFPDAQPPEVQVSVQPQNIPTVSSSVPANWYPDPNLPGYERYWDGYQWTEHIRPAMQYSPNVPPLYNEPIVVKETAEQLVSRLVYGKGFSTDKNCANCGTKLRAGSCSVCAD